MYQFVEDLREDQYKKFVQEKKLGQKRSSNKDCFYLGFAKDRKLVACVKVFIQMENQKKIFCIPLGIQTIVNDLEFFQFVKKYLIITAKKYNAQMIKIYSKENSSLLEIGFKLTKKNGDTYLPLKKEKIENVPSYFKIVEMNSDRKRRKLKEIKRTNNDLFLFNNVTFFTLQLDLYTYLDSLKDLVEKKLIERIMEENGDSIILESASIEIFNEEEAQLIELEEYSTLLQDRRKNLFFSKLKEELTNRGIKKLFFQNSKNKMLPLEQDIILEYFITI